MQKTNHENDSHMPASERSPLVIVCEQTGPQRVQMKMDELFNSSPRLPVVDEPALYASNETLLLKPVKKEAPAKSKRRISTNSAAGRSKRLEFENSQQVKTIKKRKISPFSSQAMKLAFVAVLASMFRT